MIENRFVASYMDICRELELDENEQRQLWVEIARYAERIEKKLIRYAEVTQEQIDAAYEELGVPSFYSIGVQIKAQRPVARVVIGGFTRANGVNTEDWRRVAELAPQYLR